MLQFRRQLIELDDSLFNLFQGVGDFYSTSELRDLLFHVQENRFSIPQIGKLLNELGLVFIGFEFESKIATNSFKSTYPQKNAMYSLEKWHEFEALNPSLFIGMYQFWVQKV
jgi:hypothetical protein